MYYKENINQEYVLWGSITQHLQNQLLSTRRQKLLPDSGTRLLTKMRAALHFAGFQTHSFTARVARNLPQSNDGQSQHLCPAASCILSIRHTEYEKVAYFKKLIF